MKEPTRYKKVLKKDPETGEMVEHNVAIDKPRGVKSVDFREGWEEKMMVQGSKGATMQELASLLNISQWQYKALVERDEYFASVALICAEKAEAWWLKNGRTNLTNKQFHPSLYYMNMKNRYGWKDRQDVTSGDAALPTPILAIQNKVAVNEKEEEKKDKIKAVKTAKLEMMTQKERYAASAATRAAYNKAKEEKRAQKEKDV